MIARSLRDYFRTCAICGSAHSPIDLYCESCWLNQLTHLRLKTGMGFDRENKSLFSLFNWTHSSVGRMIHDLKGECFESAFRRLAWWFVQERSKLGPIGPSVFVPAPPRRVGGRDHAHLWAESLAIHWDAPLWLGLCRLNDEEQKQKKVLERAHKRLGILKNLKGPCFDGLRVIFCDDVYTTGATARAAFEALGRPHSFEVWTLACRPRLFRV